jgi:hypothetical protein
MFFVHFLISFFFIFSFNSFQPWQELLASLELLPYSAKPSHVDLPLFPSPLILCESTLHVRASTGYMDFVLSLIATLDVIVRSSAN